MKRKSQTLKTCCGRIGTVTTLLLSLCTITSAQITLDGTMGPAETLTGPNYQISADKGTLNGANLFHSFGLFNLHAQESATFSGPNTIERVISRVTGGQTSSIDGALNSAIPGADLYFVNPAGVVFGPNAALNVDGSFHVSTADYLRLGKDGRFDASEPQKTILSSAPPSAFGFLGGNPNRIAVQGAFLQVPDGETLSVVGGDIQISDGNLRAPAGTINIVSVASQGEVVIAALEQGSGLEVRSFEELGEIEISRAEPATENIGILDELLGDVDASGEGGGAVFIRGGELVIDNSVIKADNRNEDGNSIDIDLENDLFIRNSGMIRAISTGSGEGGNIEIKAENVTLANQARIFATTGGSGRAGDIGIATNTLDVLNRALIFAGTVGPGEGGNVNIHAEHVSLSSQDAVEGFLGAAAIFAGAVDGVEGSSGQAGDVSITTNTLDLRDRALIFAGAYGPGEGGNVNIVAEHISLSGLPTSERLLEAAAIFTGTVGNIEGNSGHAGNVQITTNTLEIRDRAQIFSGTYDAGKGGGVDIAAEHILLSGTSANEQVITGISSKALQGSGDAGDVRIETNTLKVRNGAQISASTLVSGQGGDIRIHGQEIELSSGGTISASSSGQGHPHASVGTAGNIFIDAGDRFSNRNGAVTTNATQAAGGNIEIRSQGLVFLSGASIATSVAGGDENAGNITLSRPEFVILGNGSRIQANAFGGRGGNVRITTGAVIQSPDSIIEASSKRGINGLVEIRAPEVDITAGLVVLPTNFFDATTVLTTPCAERSGANVIRFVSRKYEVMPDSPHALQVRLPTTTLGLDAADTMLNGDDTRLTGWPLATLSDCLNDG